MTPSEMKAKMYAASGLTEAASGATGGARTDELYSICNTLGIDASVRKYNNCHTVQWPDGFGDLLVAIPHDTSAQNARRLISEAAGLTRKANISGSSKHMPSEAAMARFSTMIASSATGTTGSSETATGGKPAEAGRLYWKGKPIDDMTKDELVEVVYVMQAQSARMQAQSARVLDSLRYVMPYHG